MFFQACKPADKTNKSNAIDNELEPIIAEGGKSITFPTNSEKNKLFQTMKISNNTVNLDIYAPATVIGRSEKSSSNNGTIILFESSEITSVYSSFLQNQTLQKTAKINFDRVNDLYKNGAATGKELNDASAELMNIQTSLAENEAKLREVGLNPENLGNSKIGTVWLICDLPESELNIIKKGQRYQLQFPSFPNENISANIDVIAEVINTETRKVRVRLSLFDAEGKIRPGMYAKVKFDMPHTGLMIPKNAVFSSNAKNYVFVKTQQGKYELREVSLSTESGDYIELAYGVRNGEELVISNVYLLKGLSLGI